MDGLKARLSFDAVAYDYDDEYFTIDTDTHTININNVSRLFGVQYDGNSKLIKFRVRNKLSDIQKMQDSIVYINWIDSKGVKGQSIAINKTINNDTCEFAWKVPFDALKNSGVLHFAMSAVVTKNSSSVIDQRWSTQIASVITPDGIYIKSYTPSSEEEDRIAQIYTELSNMINKKNDNLQSQVNSLNKDLVDGNIATTIIEPKNLYNKDTVTVGGYIGDGGAIIAHNGFTYSDFIRIDKTQKYAIFTVFGINYVGALYNSSREFIGLVFKTSIVDNIIDFSTLKSTVPSYDDISYIRLNQTTNDIRQAMFIKGVTSYPSEYIPWTPPVYIVNGDLGDGINYLLSEYGLKKEYFNINEKLNNIAYGKNSMKNATSDYGAYNVAIGDETLVNNTGTGTDDTGNYNVAIGYKSMQANTTGNHNTAVGFQTMPVNTTGTGNTAIGEDACLSNTTGNGNTGLGRYSLFENKSGSDNTAVGLHSLRKCVGNRNTAIGQSAGYDNKGNNNIFVGYFANGKENIENSICLGQQNYCHESNTMDIGSGFIEKVIISTKLGKKLISFDNDGVVRWSAYTPPSN